MNHFSEIANTWNNKVWARDEEFAYDIVKYANLKGDETALYVGVGTGEIAGKFNVSEMWGLDISPEMMEQCKNIKRNRLIVGSSNNIPFLDNTFDFVFSRNLLKHVDNPWDTLSEMKRVVKPKGKVFTVESCVTHPLDVEYPNYCVRTVEPYHNSFRTHDWYLDLYKKIDYKDISENIYKYKSTWLSKWIESAGATEEIKKKILLKYENADEGFKERQEVEMLDDDIRSIIYWSFIEGRK